MGVPFCTRDCVGRGGLFCHHWSELSVTVISNELPMGMAKLNNHVTVSLSTSRLRGSVTALTMSDGECFVCVCQMPQKNVFQPQLGKCGDFPNRQTTGPAGDDLQGAVASVYVMSQGVGKKQKAHNRR